MVTFRRKPTTQLLSAMAVMGAPSSDRIFFLFCDMSAANSFDVNMHSSPWSLPTARDLPSAENDSAVPLKGNFSKPTWRSAVPSHSRTVLSAHKVANNDGSSGLTATRFILPLWQVSTSSEVTVMVAVSSSSLATTTLMSE